MRAGHSAKRIRPATMNMEPLRGSSHLGLRDYKHGTPTGFARRLDLRSINMEPLRVRALRDLRAKNMEPLTGFETNYEKSPNGPRRLVGSGMPASS